jgi:Sec-independent protein translocase protein TatA
MEILGVGPLEIMFILIIALIIMGPQDMVKTGKTIGRFLRRIITSPTWHTVQQTSREIKYLPNKLIRDAGLEEDIQEIEKLGKEVTQTIQTKPEFTKDLEKAATDINQSLSAWTTPLINEEDLKAVKKSPPSGPKVNAWITPPDTTPTVSAAINQAEESSNSEPVLEISHKDDEPHPSEVSEPADELVSIEESNPANDTRQENDDAKASEVPPPHSEPPLTEESQFIETEAD